MFRGHYEVTPANRSHSQRNSKAARKRKWWSAFVRSTSPSGRSNTILLVLRGNGRAPGLRTRDCLHWGHIAHNFECRAHLWQPLGVRSATCRCCWWSAPQAVFLFGERSTTCSCCWWAESEQHIVTYSNLRATHAMGCVTGGFDGMRGRTMSIGIARCARGLRSARIQGVLGGATLLSPWRSVGATRV